MDMSLISYLAGGKFNSSAWLRDALKWDSLRARDVTVDFGVKTSKTGNGEQVVGPAEYDAVLRAHCRLDE